MIDFFHCRIVNIFYCSGFLFKRCMLVSNNKQQFRHCENNKIAPIFNTLRYITVFFFRFLRFVYTSYGNDNYTTTTTTTTTTIQVHCTIKYCALYQRRIVPPKQHNERRLYLARPYFTLKTTDFVFLSTCVISKVKTTQHMSDCAYKVNTRAPLSMQPL